MLEGWAYSGDRNDLRGESRMLAAQHAQGRSVRASLPQGIITVQRGPARPAQACGQIIAAELGPQQQLP